MPRLIIGLLGLAGAAVAVVWLADHPGSVRIAWLGYRIELSAALAAVLVIAFTGVIGGLARSWRWLRTRPAAVRAQVAGRRRRRADTALAGALMAIARRDPQTALAALKRLGGAHPTLMPLLSAAAARLAGDREAWEMACETLCEAADTAALGWLGLAESASDRAKVRDHLDRAARAAPEDRFVLVRRFALDSAEGRWDVAKQGLERLAKIKGISRAAVAAARADLLAREALALLGAGDDEAARLRAREAVKAAPGRLWAALVSAELEHGAGADARATKLLTRAWRAGPHPALAGIFARLVGNETALERLRRFESFTQKTADRPESHIALAEQAIAAGMWGLARRHINAVLDRVASARALRLAADLVLGETADETAARRWRLMAAHSADSAWQCEVCGLRQADWRPDCPACATLAGFIWTPAPSTARDASGLRLEAPAGATAPDDATAADPGADIYRTLAAGEARDAAERGGDATD